MKISKINVSGHFEFLVKVIYTMVYVQSLCVITCKFAEDEREAWRKKGRMVGHLIPHEPFYSRALKKWGYTGFTLSFRGYVNPRFRSSDFNFVSAQYL